MTAQGASNWSNLRKNGAPVIRNVVATAKLADRFQLEELREIRTIAVAARRGLPWVSFRHGPNRRYVALYSNGKCLVTGCHSIDEAKRLVEEVQDTLKKHVRVQQGTIELVVHNIVATTSLHRNLDLAVLATELKDLKAEFEPEQFPALVLRAEDGTVVVLVFASGNLVIVGARTMEQVERVSGSMVDLMNILA